MRLRSSLLGLAFSTLLCAAASAQGARRVRVFVLAGQSNMEGKGFPEPAAWQIGQEAFRERYTAIIEEGDHEAFTKRLAASLEADPKRPDYAWATRDDVWIEYLGKRGPLTVGYGRPNKCFGPELGFGIAVGDALDEPVLLIKTAWGGKSLGRDFLPPSATQPTAETFAELARQRTERDAKNAEKRGEPAPPAVDPEAIRDSYGHFYRQMLEEVRGTLAELDTRFPALVGHEPVLSGFVWFQGWNDQFDPAFHTGYADNLAALVRDVRKDLEAPNLPVVIGQVGFDGKAEPERDKDGQPTARTNIQTAQLAIQSVPEFKGTLVSVPTAPFWDQEAHAIYHGPGGWQADVDKWKQHGNDRPYHYLGSPWFFLQAGTAFGEANLGLLD